MKPLSSLHQKFGEKVRHLRKQKKLTQEELAFRIGVDRSYMGFIERGERNPTLAIIGRLARILRISPRDLFG